MKRLFAKFLKEHGITILSMPKDSAIKETTLNFNNWMLKKAQAGNYEITEWCNMWMMKRFIKKIY